MEENDLKPAGFSPAGSADTTLSPHGEMRTRWACIHPHPPIVQGGGPPSCHILSNYPWHPTVIPRLPIDTVLFTLVCLDPLWKNKRFILCCVMSPLSPQRWFCLCFDQCEGLFISLIGLSESSPNDENLSSFTHSQVIQGSMKPEMIPSVHLKSYLKDPKWS